MINRIELRNKIYQGAKLAIDRLIEERAKNDDYLIISRGGKIIKVPAKELLNKYNKK